jgi:trans-2,3-dihydro-3-hydroxyanthranilate isomerase
MSEYRYRILNVFTVSGSRLSGNPLCVFEDGRDLDDVTMQKLALQFNLSETTFILPSGRAAARVRIFTPSFELPFAGHPTLGTAHVVRSLQGINAVTLETEAGVIPVTAEGNVWTLLANGPHWRAVAADRSQLAAMLGVSPEDLAASPLWVDTGSEQLLIPLNSPAAVRNCKVDVTLLERYARLVDDQYLVYVWADAGHDQVEARFFFSKDASVLEDPATGSACANLGGWFIANQAALPLSRRIVQGEAVKRPSRLDLRVDAGGHIYVSGEVIELGQGTISL